MKELQRKQRPWGLLLAVLLCAGMLLVSILSVDRVDKNAAREQTAQLRESLLRAAVTCYAIEGRYPPTLAYLCDNYGVHIDQSRFIVTYDVLGGNVMPTVAVLKKGVWK